MKNIKKLEVKFDDVQKAMEDVLRDGPVGTKIAVVSIQDIIDAGQAENVFKQLKAAQKDDNVKDILSQNP